MLGLGKPKSSIGIPRSLIRVPRSLLGKPNSTSVMQRSLSEYKDLPNKSRDLQSEKRDIKLLYKISIFMAIKQRQATEVRIVSSVGDPVPFLPDPDPNLRIRS